MKQILNISFFLFFILSFGQQTYKVTEGELQFIHPSEGMIIKKANKFLKLLIYPDIDNGKISYERKSIELNNSEYKSLLSNSENIFPKDISNYNFKELKNVKFTHNEDEDDFEEYQFFNKEIFTKFQYESRKLIELDEYYYYCFLEFDSNKKVVLLFDGYPNFIIPTDKTLKLFGNDFINKKYSYLKEKEKFSKKHYWLFSNRFSNDPAYRIDTLSNKKVKLKNYFDEFVISKQYDSINLGYFIVAHKGKRIDLYDYRFKKLNVPNIKVIKEAKMFPWAQIIQNNKLKKINIFGEVASSEDNYIAPIIYEGPGSSNFQIRIDKRDDNSFYLNDEYDFFLDNIKLINTSNIDSIFFDKNYSIEHIRTHVSSPLFNDISPIKDIIVYYKNKDNTFGINYLDSFINKNDFKYYFENEEKSKKIKMDKLQNLESIFKVETKKNKYIIKKNNLFMFFPINKDFKYRFLSNFQGSFARFELPNGQKGWLSLDGKEYFDE